MDFKVPNLTALGEHFYASSLVTLEVPEVMQFPPNPHKMSTSSVEHLVIWRSHCLGQG